MDARTQQRWYALLSTRPVGELDTRRMTEIDGISIDQAEIGAEKYDLYLTDMWAHRQSVDKDNYALAYSYWQYVIHPGAGHQFPMLDLMTLTAMRDANCPDPFNDLVYMLVAYTGPYESTITPSEQSIYQHEKGVGRRYAPGADDLNAEDRQYGPSDPNVRNPGQVADANKQCSFSAETLVSTEIGLLPIGTLAAGQRVWAYDESTGLTGLYTITAMLYHDDPVLVDLTIDGEHIHTTPEHPFFTWERGWVPARELAADDHIWTLASTWDTVESVHVRNEIRTMYNLTVDTAHTFFVGDGQWLVHNACAKPTLSRIYEFFRSGRKITLEQGNAKSGWTHIWNRHIDTTQELTATKFPSTWSEADIAEIAQKTYRHGEESKWKNLPVYTFKTNFKNWGYRTYKMTVNFDGTVRTFHALDK